MQQLSLWEEPQPVIMHNHMEVIWLSGHREIYCANSPERPADRPGDWQWEAGFVGLPMLPEACTLCHPAKKAG